MYRYAMRSKSACATGPMPLLVTSRSFVASEDSSWMNAPKYNSTSENLSHLISSRTRSLAFVVAREDNGSLGFAAPLLVDPIRVVGFHAHASSVWSTVKLHGYTRHQPSSSPVWCCPDIMVAKVTAGHRMGGRASRTDWTALVC